MPGLKQVITRWDENARAQMKDELRAILTEMRSNHQKVVGDWRKKPRFRVMSVYNKQRIIGSLIGAQAQVFQWVDKGTGQYGPKKRPYFIFPKRAPKLKFQTGYLPKTKAVARYNVGPGRAFGPWVTTDFVLHPGIKARDFTKDYWDKQVRPVLSKRIVTAIRRASR